MSRGGCSRPTAIELESKFASHGIGMKLGKQTGRDISSGRLPAGRGWELSGLRAHFGGTSRGGRRPTATGGVLQNLRFLKIGSIFSVLRQYYDHPIK
eukprot:gene20443-biopygen908